jgi:RNA polymerase I-specific transcription initiation factor RRN3
MSAGDANALRRPKDKDREAFQRGLIAVFVPNALKESMQGKMEHYNDLVAHFSPSSSTAHPPMGPMLPLIRALTSNVSLLSPEVHSELITAIVGLPWAAGEDKFVRVYIGFCGVLVSSQPGWAREVVNMAVKGLRWRKSTHTDAHSWRPHGR